MMHFCRRSTHLLVLLGTVVLSNATASALPIYSQPPQDGGDAFTSVLIPEGSNEFQQLDDFELNADAVVTGVRFWGSYFTNDAEQDNFLIRFFEEVNGEPSITPFAEYTQAELSINRMADPLTDFGGFQVYKFEANFMNQNILLSANTPYYISILNDVTVTEPDPQANDADENDWFWLASTSNTTGDRWERSSDGFEWDQVPAGDPDFRGDVAFELLPEPTTVILLANCVVICAASPFSRYRQFVNIRGI